MTTPSKSAIVAGVAIIGGFVACVWALWPPSKKRNPTAKAAARELASFARRTRRRELSSRVGQERIAARDELAELRAGCRSARLELADARAKLRAHRAELGSTCRTARQEARVRGRARVQHAKGELAAYLVGERERVAAERQARPPKLRRTAVEARAESDDAVRRDIPRELVPVFDRVRRTIKGSPRKSRSEEFLEWAEAHPEEVLDVQAELAEADVERMIAEYQATG